MDAVTAIEAAARAAKRAFGIPHTVWEVEYSPTHKAIMIRERHEGPPLTGKAKHICTTDGDRTVSGDEQPQQWPPKPKPYGVDLSLDPADERLFYMDEQIPPTITVKIPNDFDEATLKELWEKFRRHSPHASGTASAPSRET